MEEWLIPTQVISVHFEFLPVYSWTYGGAGATGILLISWCLNFLLSCLWFSLGQPSKSFTYLPSLCFKKVEVALNWGPTSWIHQRDPGSEFRYSIPLPHPTHRLDFHQLPGCLDLLGKCILKPAYVRWPINWYLEVHFTSKWKAVHKWLCLWFPS